MSKLIANLMVKLKVSRFKSSYGKIDDNVGGHFDRTEHFSVQFIFSFD